MKTKGIFFREWIALPLSYRFIPLDRSEIFSTGMPVSYLYFKKCNQFLTVFINFKQLKSWRYGSLLSFSQGELLFVYIFILRTSDLTGGIFCRFPHFFVLSLLIVFTCSGSFVFAMPVNVYQVSLLTKLLSLDKNKPGGCAGGRVPALLHG